MRALPQSVCLVGPQPPPHHGVSAVNDAVASLLRLRGIEPVLVNTAPAGLGRGLKVRLSRWRPWLHATRVLWRNGGGAAYFSLSGGLGLLYEALGVGLARMRGTRIALHHHSFRYLDAEFWPMRFLVLVAGSSALHISLGPAMARRLQARYTRVRRTLVLSNAGLIGSGDAAPAIGQSPAMKIGLVSNLSAAKGMDDFVALAEASLARGLPWRFIMAGPFESPAEEIRMRSRLGMLSNLEYRGPVYGEAKSFFFGEIDIFVFPTRYRNEAEPLVVLEALSRNVPVIAFDRGCIADMIGETGGRVVRQHEDFVATALEQAEGWRAEGSEFARRRMAARQRFEFLRAGSLAALPLLLEWMGNGRGKHARASKDALAPQPE